MFCCNKLTCFLMHNVSTRCLSFCIRVLVSFDVLLIVHLSIFISVINQLNAQNFCFTISLFHASTCFEHMCSKHVEAWNKFIVKLKFCASSWLITEIKILVAVSSVFQSQYLLSFSKEVAPFYTNSSGCYVAVIWINKTPHVSLNLISMVVTPKFAEVIWRG